MNLFFKLLLWFLVTATLVFGVMYFITWTFQTQPMFSRVQRSSRNQMIIYGGTATQIVNSEGEDGLRTFLSRLKDLEPPREVDLVSDDGKVWFGTNEEIEDSQELISRTLVSNDAVVDFSPNEKALGAAPVTFPDGSKYVLVLQWETPRAPSFFFGSWLGYLRLAGMLLTGVVFCSLLALYLSSPIRKIRDATQKLADGDLSTRVADKVGNRRDELAYLARDFDLMAERIEKLITSQKRLTRDISHELRSPLARMNVALEIARTKANPETQPVLDRLEGESQRLNDMISRLLTLSKLESGSQDFERSTIDLDFLVKEIAEDADYEARANGKSVNIVASTKCRVMGNETLLRSAIENVLRNGVRYTKEGTAVTVALTNGSREARISIVDHGGGVPDEELAKLFRPFHRVEEARDRGTGGTGLGLAIAEQAVRAHKGSISAQNTADGLRVDIVLTQADGSKGPHVN
ncbi:MAG TPA: ATP-binding protein [Pyrinomonadaceae bacterium]|nr:ATP-binding protein [Pyrinomonadaceae bacterium]